MTALDKAGLVALADRVEAVSMGRDRELDEAAAVAMGWQVRRVSRLGLTGRTPGSMRWFRPYGEETPRIGLPLPNMTGPMKRKATAAALRAIAAGQP